MSTIICAGRCYTDLVFTGLDRLPEAGREHYGKAITLAPGGGAFITAAHLAGLGQRVVLATALGDDAVSRAMRAQIERAGAELLAETFQDGPQLTVSLAIGEDRAMVTHRAGPAVPATLRARLRAATHLHLAELATLLEAPWLLPAARDAGCTVSLDVAWDDAALADPRARALAGAVDLLLPNEAEAEALGGSADTVAQLDVLAANGAVVAIKRGAQGAACRAGGQTWWADALPASVVDATGAGDAFAAGFLDAWLAAGDPAAALARGIAAGTLAVAQPGGATRVPDRPSLLRLAAQVTVRALPVRKRA